MNPLILKTSLALALATASLSAAALGRFADIQVIDRNTGQTLPVHTHRGEFWVAGQPGAKYAIQVRNRMGSRLLAVTSVDGLNVLTGATADYGQSGYVFHGGQRYSIEGWRKSDQEVAAFVFTSSGDSYAERVGKPRDMGVIGVALFRERPPVPVYSPPAEISKQEAPASSRANSADQMGESNSPRPTAPSAAAPAARSAAPAPAPAPLGAAGASPSSQADSGTQKSAPSAEAKPERERSTAAPMPAPKLGTAHGEREHSVVSRTQFTRNSTQPDEIIRIRYDSHANLVALGVIPSARPYPVPNPFPGAQAGFVPDPQAWR